MIESGIHCFPVFKEITTSEWSNSILKYSCVALPADGHALTSFSHLISYFYFGFLELEVCKRSSNFREIVLV